MRSWSAAAARIRLTRGDVNVCNRRDVTLHRRGFLSAIPPILNKDTDGLGVRRQERLPA